MRNEEQVTVDVIDTRGDFEEDGTKLLDCRDVTDAPLERDTDVEDETVAVRDARIEAEELADVVTLGVGFGDVDDEKDTVEVELSAAIVDVTERELPTDTVASNLDALCGALVVGEMEEETERVELYEGVGERL